MKTQAAARRAKRRKLEAIESPEHEGESRISSLPATDAPDPNPPGAGGDESRSQEPSPSGAGGGQEGDGVDRFSCLPDAILGELTSLLPTKDAARTQTLATRWRHLWHSAPLNLDAGVLANGEGLLPFGGVANATVVSHILSAHRGPARRFRVSAQHLQDGPATVDAWLRSPALDNLQEIEFYWVNPYRPVVLPMPPTLASVFRFSSCLCVATLSQCHLDIAQRLQFPQLKKLALQRVSISEDSLQSMIAGCPVLECLVLKGSVGFQRVRLNSASITTIGVSSYYEGVPNLEEFVIEDAPCLERFLYLHRYLHLRLSVISAPKLETLGPLNDYDLSFRALGSRIIQPYRNMGFQTHLISSIMRACTVKILALDLLNLSLDVIIDLMRSLPLLEKLYIEVEDNNLWRCKHGNLIRCLDIHLKTVVFNKYRGIRSAANFAAFFVLNAKLLESMRFHGVIYNVNKRFLAEQHQLLQLEKRASRGARFYFTTERCHHDFIHANHAHDLSVTDPFECVETEAGVCVHPLSGYGLS